MLGVTQADARSMSCCAGVERSGGREACALPADGRTSQFMLSGLPVSSHGRAVGRIRPFAGRQPSPGRRVPDRDRARQPARGGAAGATAAKLLITPHRDRPESIGTRFQFIRLTKDEDKNLSRDAGRLRPGGGWPQLRRRRRNRSQELLFARRSNAAPAPAASKGPGQRFGCSLGQSGYAPQPGRILFSMEHIFESSLDLPQPREDVFRVLSRRQKPRAHHSARIGDSRSPTPLPIDLKAGAIIDYRLRLFGAPFRWRTRITTWEPPLRFVDEQARGPYALWVHTHSFEALGANRTHARSRPLPPAPPALRRHGSPANWAADWPHLSISQADRHASPPAIAKQLIFPRTPGWPAQGALCKMMPLLLMPTRVNSPPRIRFARLAANFQASTPQSPRWHVALPR